MLNLLLLLLFLSCVGVTAAWIAENPGSVTIYWFDYRIDTSFAFLLVLALLSAIALAYTYILLRKIAIAPYHFADRKSIRNYRKGMEELTYGVAALAAADSREAAAHTRKAEKFLGRTPLTLLLSAQIARSEGDDETTRNLLGQMLEHKETEYLAARFLSDSASKQQLFPKALALAQRAHTLNPKGVVPLLSLHVRMGEWNEAMHVVHKAKRKGSLTRAQIRHYEAIVSLKQARQLLDTNHPEPALAAAKRAVKSEGDFAPCVAVAARAYTACGQPDKALRLLSGAWKKEPHALLASAFLDAAAKLPAEKQMKAAGRMASLRPESNESDMLLAQAAMLSRDWIAARKALTNALAKAETVRTCQLMAKVEQGEYPDFDISSKWIARSATALSDPGWVCGACGKAALLWDTHCPECDSFDTLEWKSRDMTFAG